MSRTTRRDFAKTAAVAVVALPALAQTPPAPEKPPAASPLGHALAGVVLAQSGQFLTAEEFAAVEKDWLDSAQFLARFREFKLTNADEPWPR